MGLDCDYVILDLAPGAAYNVADFSIIAQKSILVTTPEIPSLMNIYSFMKAALHRRLTHFFKHEKSPELLELLEKAKNPDANPQLKTIEGLFIKAREINADVAEAARKNISKFEPIVLINRIRTKKDIGAGDVIRNIMKEYLSIESGIVMTIREDDAVGKAIAKCKPVITAAPSSPFSRDIKEAAAKLYST